MLSLLFFSEIMVEKDSSEASKYETVPPQVDDRVGRHISGFRPASKSEPTQIQEEIVASIDVEGLVWDDDEETPTAVETPKAKEKERKAKEKKHLHAIGTIGVGKVKVSAADFQIWQDFVSRNFGDVSKVTSLIPRYARSLVEGWEGSDLILGSLKTLNCSLARVFAEWEGNVLHFPGVQFTEPGALEILEQAKAQKVIVGNGIIKIPTRE